MYEFNQEASLRLMNALGEIYSDELTDEDIDAWKAQNHYQFLQTSEEIHAFADKFNWDDSREALTWILENPKCELGTAVMIYWKATPLYFYEKYESREQLAKQKPSYCTDEDWFQFQTYDLIKMIEKKFDEGFYKTRVVQYSVLKDENLLDDFEEHASLIESGGLKQPIHLVALLEMEGENFNYKIDWSALEQRRKQP
jgi:Domain of unknown function (DUF4274)